MMNVEKENKVKSILIVVILFLLTFVVGMCLREYQREEERPPEIYVRAEDGKEAKMMITSYNWKYKNKDNVKEEEIDYDSIDSQIFNNEEYVIENEAKKDFEANTDPEYKIDTHAHETRKYINGKIQGQSGGDTHCAGAKDVYFYAEYDAGLYIQTKSIEYVKQGTVNYAIKEYIYPANSSIIKPYLGTNIENKEKVEELVKKLKFGSSFKNLEIDGNTLKLKYEFFGTDYSLYENNLELFSTINGLEKIVYEAENNKALESKGNQSYISEKDKIEYTKKDVEKFGGIEIQRYQKYLKNK